jgi:prepilin-type N-terminal cleavage/methylation domain-containing protein
LDGDAGFSLVEVMIAAGLLASLAAGIAQVFGLAVRASHAARVRTVSTILAAQKMEQLRSLEWTCGPGGEALSDTSTDLSSDPSSDAGPGLAPSPSGTLEANVPFYVDYLDAAGRWVGGGPSPPAAAVYVRRWAVQPLPGDPENMLALHVLVIARAPVAGAGGATADAARLVSIRARR